MIMNEEGKTLVVPVILCGGSGTRLWPLSRESYPKQFLKLAGAHSLFQQTLLRIKSLTQADLTIQEPIIVTNEAHRFLVLDQLHQIDQSAEIILEPIGKNTAPSLTLAALKATDLYENGVLIVLPADHAINDNDDFCSTLNNAVSAVTANKIKIGTLGIKPTYAETGYGYIECQIESTESSYHKIARFVEKPNLKLAQQYIEQSNFYWNSGVFIIKSQFWLTAIEKFDSDIFEGTASAWYNKKIRHTFYQT
ncbi:mannose-1-phosphate guanylyltransferase [Psychrobacter sp. JCM 18901]|nr:mannose-1-phosphate guanylyltransferase [Psychrobacter sp. JCM 18901]